MGSEIVEEVGDWGVGCGMVGGRFEEGGGKIGMSGFEWEEV